jgi:membrane associated rhomboid family serine protease
MIPLHDDNPTELKPYFTISIIVLCCLVFLWQLSLGRNITTANLSLGVIPAVLFDFKSLPEQLTLVPAWMTIITSMFLHGGWMHLLGNMLYLWIFGNNIEDAMGHVRFILFYLVCGVASVLAQSLPNPHSEIPLIGASGAISGVLGAYLLLYPHARVLVAIPFGFIIHTVRLPAGWVLGFWFLLQIISQMTSSSDHGGVAWGAHIGGFVTGMALVPLFRRKGIQLFNPGH